MSEPHDKSAKAPVSGDAANQELSWSGPRTREAEFETLNPKSARSQGMKVVTVSPAQSTPDLPIPPRPARADPYIGYMIDDRYLVETLLGEGGMGVVYQCRHKIIGKKVAMKVLRADMARDVEVTERFLNEARSASAIGNLHIIDISDFGQLPDGSTYFVMEFLDGVPLSDVVREAKPVAVPRILHIAKQLAEGLAAAHSAGIVHRDLKPDNIFLVPRGNEKEFVKILDFGIAKVSSAGEGKLTRAGAVFGTPHYMSPEQAAGAPVDHRGDIYSLGVILYELASGRVPFDADNFMGILTQHMYKSPVPIRALVPEPQEVPPGLEAIVLKCLSKRPEQRYQSMEELIIELDKLKQGVIPDAVPEMMARSGGFNVPADYFKKGAGLPAPVPATPESAPRVRTRWPLYAGVAGVLAAIAIVVGIFAKSAASDAATASNSAAAAAHAARAGNVKPLVEPSSETLTVTRQVFLAAEPLDAHVFKNGQDLGASPVVLDVEDGKSIEIDIVRRGYKTQRLTVDGSEARLSIKLEREAVQQPVSARRSSARSAPAAAPDKGKTKPKSSYSEIVNPWE